MTVGRERRTIFLALALLGAVPAPRAENAPAPPRQIEEIVVTAQKKEESIQDVPISCRSGS